MTAVRPASIAAYAGLWTALGAAAALAPQLTGNTFDVLLPALLTITGQWLLLRDRTSWATRWAVAGIIGSLVPTLAAIAVHVFAPRSRLALNPVYGCLVQIGTAVPAVLALLPLVGARALALFLAPLAAWATRHFGFGPVAWPLLSVTPPPPWLPALSAVPPAIRAVVEAAVLTWLIVVTRRRAPASIGERPAADPVTAASPLLVRLLPVWALVGVVLVLVLSALTGGRRGYAPPPGQTLLIVFVVAPYVLGLASTFVPMARPLGLSALAIGAGGVALIGAPIVAGWAPWLLMGGSGVTLLAVPALHGALAALAFRAMWLTTAPARRSVALVGGGVLMLVYAVAVLAVFPVYRTQIADQRNAEARARPDARAVSVHNALNGCFYRVQRASASPAWPRTIDDLGPNGLRCLTAEELRPADHAYALHVTAPPGDAPPSAFAVCITRARGGRVHAQVVSERDTQFGNEAEGDSVATACVDAAGDVLGRARYCLWSWAATHGAYPETLDALLAHGGCLARQGRGGSDDMRLTYLPGRQGGAGPVSTFVIIYGPTKGAAFEIPRYRLDHTGTVRSTREPRLPTARDPLDRMWQPRPSDRRRRGDQSGDADWARTCEDGRLADCVVLGEVLEARAVRWANVMLSATDGAPAQALPGLDGRSLSALDLARARDVYLSACRAGAAGGCAHAARLLMTDEAGALRDEEVWRLRARACDLGDAASCDAQSADDAPGRPRGGPTDARALTAACAGGSRTACTAAGRLSEATSGPGTGARGLFLRGCDLGDAQACFDASRLSADGAPLAAPPEDLRALACSLAPQPAGCALPEPRRSP
jgi:hypothetical protein